MIRPVNDSYETEMTMCDALLDTGCSGNLIDLEFYKKHFPLDIIERTNATLSYATSNLKTNVTKRVRMCFFLEGNPTNCFNGSFLMTPDLSVNVYIGGEILHNEHIVCHSSSGIYSSPNGITERKILEANFTRKPHIILSPIRYFTRKQYIEAIRQEVSCNQCEQTSSHFLRGDNQKLVSPPRPPTNVQLHNGGTGTSKDFDKAIASYDISQSDKIEMRSEYYENGRTQIPVSQYINETSKCDTFNEPIDSYYTTLDDLMETLNINHLPSNLVHRVRSFFEENISIFSTSELDVGYVPFYKAKVSLKRNVITFTPKI